MDNRHVRFFWIGEESELFVAESIDQLVADRGSCGTGIHSSECVLEAGEAKWTLFDYHGTEIEWGEFDGSLRTTIRECDENERPLGTLTGSLLDIYAHVDGGRRTLPVMLMTQYN